MKLWLLKPRRARQWPFLPSAWPHDYDTTQAIVVRAATAAEARRIAAEQERDAQEGGVGAGWLDPEQSTCVSVKGDGKPGVIIVDFYEP